VTRRRLGVLGLAFAAWGLGACGYAFRGTLPPHVKTVAVPIFLNRTAEPGVESIITRAVVQAFATNGRLKVVRLADADAVIKVIFEAIPQLRELKPGADGPQIVEPIRPQCFAVSVLAVENLLANLVNHALAFQDLTRTDVVQMFLLFQILPDVGPKIVD